MKKPKDVPELASQLAAAASAPLVSQTAPQPAEGRGTGRRPPNRSSKSVFLRVPADLYAKFDSEAINRTKATGRGVTVQQVILDKLARSA